MTWRGCRQTKPGRTSFCFSLFLNGLSVHVWGTGDYFWSSCDFWREQKLLFLGVREHSESEPINYCAHMIWNIESHSCARLKRGVVYPKTSLPCSQAIFCASISPNAASAFSGNHLRMKYSILHPSEFVSGILNPWGSAGSTSSFPKVLFFNRILMHKSINEFSATKRFPNSSQFQRNGA